MQLAKVSAIHKKGVTNDIGNYRPISILPGFSNVFKTILHNRLSSFSDRHSLLNAAQFGFRKHRSTEAALSVQKEFILERII